MATRKLMLCILVLLLCIPLIFAATRTFRVQETDFVRIVPQAVDLDRDSVVFNFSEPLDEKGEWQTDYGDAGEYDIEIVASDGIDKTLERMKLIVEEKNRPPQLTVNTITVNEDETVNLRDLVTDPNGDVLTFQFEAPFNAEGLWQPGYDDAGRYVVEFTVSDGKEAVTPRVEIVVLHKNQPPRIVQTFSSEENVEMAEGETLNFYVEAEDGDDDRLTYQWLLDDRQISSLPMDKVSFDFSTAGEHVLKVIISDGSESREQQWILTIKNTNRRPQLKFIPITANEGERVILDLPERDLDGDLLSYTFEEPLDAEGKWQTDFDDAGEYELTVSVSDGEFTVDEEMAITVINVDRAPTLNLPPQVHAKEGEGLFFVINADDKDGDDVNVTIHNAPSDSQFDQHKMVFSWEPGFEEIQRKENVFTNFLNVLRLEHFFLRNKEIPLEITACGKQKCTNATVSLIVWNTNRPPVLELPTNLTFKETDTVNINDITAYDPDGDIVTYTFTSPLMRRSGQWQTSYDDAGEYVSYVTASDGRLSSTEPLLFMVENVNRIPRLDIKHDKVVVNERQDFTIRVNAEDPDSDTLNLTAQNLPEDAAFKEQLFNWMPSHDVVENNSKGLLQKVISRFPYLNKKFSKDQKVEVVEFVAADSEFSVIHPVTITVKNVNRRPEIVDFLPESHIEVLLNEPVLFHVAATDSDGDPLSYRWVFGIHEPRVEGTATVERVFVTPGEKKVSVIISDGTDRVQKTWTIDVLPIVNEESIVSEEFYEVYVVGQ